MIGEQMPTADELDRRRQGIIEEISSIDRMRVGSISDQVQKKTRKDGSVRENGPYTILTYKNPDGKTRTERVHDEDIGRIVEEIDNHRRFNDLASEYVAICVEAARAVGAGTPEQDAAKKN
jgi:hypothetical protein